MDAAIPSFSKPWPRSGPRHRRGSRYSVATILTFAVCAMVSGARSLYAIAQWGRDRGSAEIHGAFGMAGATTASVATVSRVFRDLSRDAFERVLAEWARVQGPARGGSGAGRQAPPRDPRRTARACIWWPPSASGWAGAGPKRGTLKEHELRLAEALLADLDLHGVTVTGDAQFCQRALSHQVVAAGSAYLWAVEDDQHRLLEALVALFTLEPPPGVTFARAVQRRAGTAIGRKSARCGPRRS